MTILVQQLRAEIEQLKAENAALEKRLCICQECGGRGEVHTGEYTYEGEWQPPEPVMVECGECGGDGQIGGIQDLDAVIIERDQLKVENARWQKNYEHLIEQHMPRTGHGCEEGWSRVIEARELQEIVERLTSENDDLKKRAQSAFEAGRAASRRPIAIIQRSGNSWNVFEQRYNDDRTERNDRFIRGGFVTSVDATSWARSNGYEVEV